MEVRHARDAVEVRDALDLRERVFCGEQGVSPEAERDGRDEEAIQVVAVDGGAVVATCRLLVEGAVARLGRMAVDPAARRRGVGLALLEAAERCAVAAGATTVTLHAQVAVQGLYLRGGYTPYGEPFVEEGIEHVSMEKLLPTRTAVPEPQAQKPLSVSKPERPCPS